MSPTLAGSLWARAGNIILMVDLISCGVVCGVYVTEPRILQPDTSDLISSEKLPLAGMHLMWLLETTECGWITAIER